MIRQSVLFALSLCFTLAATLAGAADVTVETVLSDLHRPCGIAVRPGGTADRFELFIAESGAGRVVRWSNRAPQQVAEAITGFEASSAADASSQTGPHALQFLDPGLLVVGTTQGDGGDLLRAYELPDGEKVLTADASTETTSKGRDLLGATCTSVTRSHINEFVPDRLFLTVRGTDGAFRLLSSRVQAGMVSTPQEFGAKDEVQSPRAVATSNTGRVVVGDSTGQLMFCSPIDGKVELAVATDLKGVVGLAYNPASGSLYAADSTTGIYRIDDTSRAGRPSCHAVKVADAAQPTALAFAPDGSMYVVTFGTTDDDGSLITISGNL